MLKDLLLLHLLSCWMQAQPAGSLNSWGPASLTPSLLLLPSDSTMGWHPCQDRTARLGREPRDHQHCRTVNLLSLRGVQASVSHMINNYFLLLWLFFGGGVLWLKSPVLRVKPICPAPLSVPDPVQYAWPCRVGHSFKSLDPALGGLAWSISFWTMGSQNAVIDSQFYSPSSRKREGVGTHRNSMRLKRMRSEFRLTITHQWHHDLILGMTQTSNVVPCNISLIESLLFLAEHYEELPGSTSCWMKNQRTS